MTIEVGVLSVIVAFLALVTGYQTYQLNKGKETKTETRQDAKIEAKLEYIGKGVDDIRIDLKANEKQLNQFGERVAKVEESSKQAHKRIDKLENKGESA
jgi:hypothetical protein